MSLQAIVCNENGCQSGLKFDSLFATKRGCGGIGRHAVLRGQWREPCRFESGHPHQINFRIDPKTSEKAREIGLFCCYHRPVKSREIRLHPEILAVFLTVS